MDYIKCILPHQGLAPTLMCAELSELSGKKKIDNPRRVSLTGFGCDSVLRPGIERACVATNTYSADYEIAIFCGQALRVLESEVTEARTRIDAFPSEWLEYGEYLVRSSDLCATIEILGELVTYAIEYSLSVTIVFD